MFLSGMAAELCICSWSLWRVSQQVGAGLLADESSKDQTRATQQGSLSGVRENTNPRQAGEEMEQGR